MKRVLMTIATAMWAATLLPSSAYADDKEIIEYREHVMKTLDAQTAALGLILATSIPDDNVMAHLEAISLTASTALKAFEPKVTGGEARAKVWADWADFSKRMTDFDRRMREQVALGKQKGKDAALATIIDALVCKDCHDIYREEKKK